MFPAFKDFPYNLKVAKDEASICPILTLWSSYIILCALFQANIDLIIFQVKKFQFPYRSGNNCRYSNKILSGYHIPILNLIFQSSVQPLKRTISLINLIHLQEIIMLHFILFDR